MANETVQKVRQRADNYKQALKCLDECGDLTYDKLREANQIAGIDMSESELQEMWKKAGYIFSSDNHPGGKEFLRFELRKTLIEGITTFEAIADKLGTTEKKWWQFWK